MPNADDGIAPLLKILVTTEWVAPTVVQNTVDAAACDLRGVVAPTALAERTAVAVHPRP